MKAIKAPLWASLIPVACLLLVLSVLTATAADARPCNGGLGHANRGKNFAFNLSSGDENIRLSRQVFRKTGLDEVTITVNGGDKTLQINDMVSAAEFIAAKQVLKDGTQEIVITDGVATGGSFLVNQIMHPGHLSSIVISAGVVGVWAADRPMYNITRVLQLDQGDIQGGILVGIAGRRDALTIRTGTLQVGELARLTTIVDQSLAGQAPDLLNSSIGQQLDLNLFTHCACINNGEISASGNLLISTKTDIVNHGLISSQFGNVTLTGIPGHDLFIDNLGGQITALAGDINVRLANFMASSLTNLAGGLLQAEHININGGNGPVVFDVDEIIGIARGRSGSADITVDHGTLDVGTLTASRGGITLTNKNGDVDINVLENDPNHLLAANKVGDIRITAGEMTLGNIQLGDSTNISTAGGNIIILASGNVDGGNGMTLTAHAANAPGNSGNFDSGGIQIVAGTTSGSDLEHLIATRPSPFEIQPTGLDPSSIGITTLNHNNVGLLQVNQDGGAINLGGSTVNIFGGVVLLETAGSGQITTGPSTFSSLIPVSYVAGAPAPNRTQEDLVVDTGEDDPGAFDEEVVASQ